jgi:tellurite methyltransferase
MDSNDIDSKEWWEQRYNVKTDYLYSKEPSSFLGGPHQTSKKGETLDLAMGEGRNAVYLAKQGFNVTGIDFSPTACDRAKALAYENNVKLDIKNQTLDFFLIPLMKYDTIVISNFHPHQSIVKNLVRGLTVGGTLFIEGYTKEQITHGKGFKPEFKECFGSNEVLRELTGLKIMVYNERQMNDGEFRVQCIGVKTSM